MPCFTRAGMKFEYRIDGEWRKLIGSTLVPGTTVVESKPTIWASSSYAYFHSPHNNQKEQITLGKNVDAMLERAQQALLARALAEEYNAVLGIKQVIFWLFVCFVECCIIHVLMLDCDSCTLVTSYSSYV